MFFLKEILTFSLIIGIFIPNLAVAHGYASSPASRAYQCKLENAVTKCGSVIYEPQSLEAPSGFPSASGPADGKIASAGINAFALLDNQNASLWTKQPIKAGKNSFTWTLTASHATSNWRYYITKQDWNPNAPLTRNSFELTPFCSIDDNSTPPQTATHSCNVPQRTGYQVIYAVWEIGNTINSFYNVIDVQFDEETSAGQWPELLTGNLSGKDLNVGDKVIAHFYDANGNEALNNKVELDILDTFRGQSANWSYDLATKINQRGSEIRAGIKNSAGNVNPVVGSNNVYAKSNSPLRRVGITYVEKPATIVGATVSNVVGDKIKNGTSKISFDVEAKGSIIFQAIVTDSSNIQKGNFPPVTMTNNKQSFDMIVNNVSPGIHALVYTVKHVNGSVIEQGTKRFFTLESSTVTPPTGYDFIFPENLNAYKEGTVILQPKNSKKYRCKPYPYSGYCRQWNPNATAYEPGVGHAWESAWEQVN